MPRRFDVGYKGNSRRSITAADLRPSEAQDQIAVMEWLSFAYPRAFKVTHHSPNGEKRDKVTGAKLKKMGVKSGFPDLVTYLPAQPYSGLVIELKSGAGVTSSEQALWLDHFKSIGYWVEVAVGVDECMRVYQRYMELAEG